jgi:hypothetical protein
MNGIMLIARIAMSKPEKSLSWNTLVAHPQDSYANMLANCDEFAMSERLTV